MKIGESIERNLAKMAIARQFENGRRNGAGVASKRLKAKNRPASAAAEMKAESSSRS
jgi:hypothetical protein